MYCNALYWWGGHRCPMHCDLFKIYCALPWLCRLNFAQMLTVPKGTVSSPLLLRQTDHSANKTVCISIGRMIAVLLRLSFFLFLSLSYSLFLSVSFFFCLPLSKTRYYRAWFVRFLMYATCRGPQVVNPVHVNTCGAMRWIMAS